MTDISNLPALQEAATRAAAEGLPYAGSVTPRQAWQLVSQGLAVIMVSSELPEVMGMADRIIVMHEGLMVAEYQAGEATAETIVSAASGIGQEAA